MLSGVSKFFNIANKVQKKIDARSQDKSLFPTKEELEAKALEVDDEYAFATSQEELQTSLKRKVASNIAKQLGGKYTYRAEVPDDIAHHIGDYGSKISVDGNDVYFQMASERSIGGKDTIYLPNIAVTEKSKGLGTKFMNAMKDFADKTGQDIVVYKVTNPKYFKKFDWLKDDDGTFKYTPETRNDRTYSDFEEIWKIERASKNYGSEAFLNDPNRAYTFEEGRQLQPPNRDARSDAAHTVRGQEGYLLSPYTEPKYDQATFEKYVQDYDKKFARENLMDYEGDKVRLEKAMQGMIEDYPSQGLIDMMEGSKYTLERPMYISRNIGYRMNPPKPTDVDANNVYSAKMVDPNNPNFVDKMERDFDSYGMFGSMPYIIRLDKGTEVYHPSYNADSGEIVIKGSDIQDSQKFKLDEFLQMNPEDIKKGTDWFSSLGLMNNIA